MSLVILNYYEKLNINEVSESWLEQHFRIDSVRSSTSASVTRDVTSNGGQREAPVRCSSSRDAREQCCEVGHRQGVPLAGRGGGAAARGHLEDGGGQVGRPHRLPGRSLLPPRLGDWDRQRGCGSPEQQPRSAGTAAPEPGALAPAAGSPFTEVRPKESFHISAPCLISGYTRLNNLLTSLTAWRRDWPS